MLYSKVNLGLRDGVSLDNYSPDMWESLKLGFEEGWETGPYKSAERAMSRDHFDAFPDMTEGEIIDFAKDWEARGAGLDLDSQAELIRAAGMEGKVKPDPVYDADTLTAVLQARSDSEGRRFILDKVGFAGKTAAFAGELAGGMVDPLNVVSMFIPVIGEERKLALLARAGGAWGRAGTRAALGAAEGAIGAAAVEGITLGAQSLMQQEYGPLQSLMNIAGGAILGGAFGAAGGAIKEWRLRDEWIKPWQTVAHTEESRRLLAQHAGAISRARRAADPKLDKAVADREGLAHAMAYDIFTRNRAFTEKKSVADVYREWQIDYTSGKITFTGTEKAAGAEGAQSLSSHGTTPPDPNAAQSLPPVDLSKPIPMPEAPPAPDEVIIRKNKKDVVTSKTEIYEHQKAIVDFFDDAGATDAGYGLIHIMRRQMQEAATGPDASPRARAMWREVEEACGVEPGSAWSLDASEKFAQAAARYFWHDKTPEPRLAPALMELRQTLAHMYLEKTDEGLPENAAAQKAISKIFQPAPEDWRKNFRQGFLDMLLVEHAETPHPFGTYTGQAPNLGSLTGADLASVEKEVRSLYKSISEDLASNKSLDAETRAELTRSHAEALKEYNRTMAEADALEIYAACLLGKA